MVATPGGLLKAIQTHAEAGNRLGILVVDEDSTSSGKKESSCALSSPTNSTVGIQRVIRLAQVYSVPIWLIQFDHSGLTPTGLVPARDPSTGELPGVHMDLTRTPIRALLPVDTPIVTKHAANAFNGTNLTQLLQQSHGGLGPTYLVITGWNSNACVAATAGVELISPWDPGAIQNHWHVLSGRLVLHGPPANWVNHPNVSFYNEL